MNLSLQSKIFGESSPYMDPNHNNLNLDIKTLAEAIESPDLQ